MEIRSRRSVLYLPASNAKALAKARTLACDAVILDLEDAVGPEAKLAAREQCAAAVRAGGFGTRELIVRVNGRDTEWGPGDLDAVRDLPVDAILLPKVSSAADVAAYAAALGPGCRAALWAMIETALAILRIHEIAALAVGTRLECLVLGTNDLARELAARPGTLRTPLVGILGTTVVAARAYGLAVLDGVFNAIEDDAGFEVQCRQAVDFGFDGKTLVHPRQIDACNAAFTPDEAAVAWARRVVAAFDDPAHASRGAIRVDGRMVERLHLVEARRTLALARAAGRDVRGAGGDA